MTRVRIAVFAAAVMAAALICRDSTAQPAGKGGKKGGAPATTVATPTPLVVPMLTILGTRT